jgi:hypothetical protein
VKTFCDALNRKWEVIINVAAVKRVRDLVKVDLAQVTEQLVKDLMSDPVLLCDVLFALVQPAAASAQVSDEEFGRGMGGDALEAATAALLDELIDFFPKSRRQVMERAREKQLRMEAAGAKAISELLEGDQLEKAFAQKVTLMMQDRLAEIGPPARPSGS